jgi:hypothetical protein
MNQDEIQAVLRRFKTLGLVIGALIREEDQRERRLFSLGRYCGRPLREFLAEADPDEDPVLYWEAIQALEAMREDQRWIQRHQAGLEFPIIEWWS